MEIDKAQAKEALTKAFHLVDKDKSNYIDKQEIEHVINAYLRSIGQPCDADKCRKYAADFLKEVDKNKDNKISLEEFLNYFMQFCK